MARIPEQFIQNLLARADIAEVVGRSVTLKKAGANLLGLCPFHQEKSPSFTVSPAKQFYHCFGCGVSGSVISFVMSQQGIDFAEAVQQLAAQYGMPLPKLERESPEQQAKREQTPTLLDFLSRASNFYRQQLASAPLAQTYLKQRGVNQAVAEQYELGFAPNGFQQMRELFGTTALPHLIEAGLVVKKEEGDPYDRFRGRLMFPIKNPRGQVLGFGARVLDDSLPKYLNSPETPLFEKGRELYGLFEARNAIRQEKMVLVVEGYMDVVALAQFGFGAAVATLGTACTPTHIQKLFRQSDRIVFSFDGDKAGRKAALRALQETLPFVTEQKIVQFLFLPPEHDPDSFIRANGPEGFRQALKAATSLSQYFLDAVTDENDLTTVEGRAATVSVGRQWLEKIQARDLRVQLTRALAQHTETPIQEFAAPSVTKSSSTKNSKFAAKNDPLQTLPQANRRLNTRQSTHSLEKQIFILLLAQPKLFEMLSNIVKERCIERLQQYHAIGDLFGLACQSFTTLEVTDRAYFHEFLRQKDQRFDALIIEAQMHPLQEEALLFEQFNASVQKCTLDAVDQSIAQLTQKKGLAPPDLNALRDLYVMQKNLRARYLQTRQSND